MIAKILISPELENRLEEINNTLASHLKGINLNLDSPVHPDLLYFPENTKLGVGEAKEIREFFSIKPYSAKGRVVILEDAGNLTPEAQNGLLKTLEEPPEEAILLLAAATTDNFLPTILSRCEVVTLSSLRDHEMAKQSLKYQMDIENLLTQDIAERFEYIEKLKDQKKKEELLYALTGYFHQNLRS